MSAISNERAEALIALAVSQKPPIGPHPSDDLLAAWHEHALESDSAARVERHVAHCDRCFAVWFGVLALEPAPQREPASARSGWFVDLVSNRSRLGRMGMVAATLIGAIAVSIVWFDQPPELPGYTVTVEGSTTYFRNGAPTTDETVRFMPGNVFNIVFRPDTEYSGAIDAALYLVGSGGTVSRLVTPPPQATDAGAVRIDADVGTTVVLPPGEAQLLVVVGRRGRLPDSARLQRDLRRQRIAMDDHWRAWRIPIEVAGQ